MMGDLLLDHVREEEVRYHGDRDDVSTLVDQLGNLLVLQTHHVLAVHLKFKKKFMFYFIFKGKSRYALLSKKKSSCKNSFS